MGIKKAQMKIQQMAFMIVAVFFFFILVGIFFIRINSGGIGKSLNELQKEEALSSLKVIANMPEFSCNNRKSLCLDEDKLRVMSGNFSRAYDDFWPVASIEINKVYPKFNEEIDCPQFNCNHYQIFDNGQKSKETVSTYVSICREVGKANMECEIGKLSVGAKIYEE